MALAQRGSSTLGNASTRERTPTHWRDVSLRRTQRRGNAFDRLTAARWFLRICSVLVLANFYRELGARHVYRVRSTSSVSVKDYGGPLGQPKQPGEFLRDFYRTNAINVIVPPGAKHEWFPGREVIYHVPR